MRILYSPNFLRQFNKLSSDLQDEVEAAVISFRRNTRDRSLKIHKLQGKLRRLLSFSVNYRFRIVCKEKAPGVWALLAVGDHDIYR